jgi:hypothetical protein
VTREDKINLILSEFNYPYKEIIKELYYKTNDMQLMSSKNDQLNIILQLYLSQASN